MCMLIILLLCYHTWRQIIDLTQHLHNTHTTTNIGIRINKGAIYAVSSSLEVFNKSSISVNDVDTQI